MITVNDQLGNKLEFANEVNRIISLVPSLTELLFHLALEEKIVGRTKFCIYPEDGVSGIDKVGGTKTPNIEEIRSLAPDFIIANKEENRESDIEILQTICPVYVSDIIDLDDNSRVIEDIGQICNCPEEANLLNTSIIQNFQIIEPSIDRIRVAYFIWKDPYMVAGSKNFINSIIDKIGLENIYAKSADRYPTINLDELKNEEVILLLSSEPFPFSEKHIEEIQQTLPQKQIEFVDATYFSWYGSRMVEAPKYLSTLKKRIKENLQSHTS